MASPALSSSVLSSPSTSRLGPGLGSSYGEHLRMEVVFWRAICWRPVKGNAQRHRLSAVLSEPITEAAPLEVSEDQEKQKKGRSRGRGGRRFPKVSDKNPAKMDMPSGSGASRLEWLKQEGVDLTSECILETDELCTRSATGLLELQRTIWRINRAIAQCSSVTEALGVVEEMKTAGFTTANEGTYLALITVCRRQRQGERALSILEAMKQAGVQPAMLTYNTLISCCQQALRLEDGFQIKAEMEAAGVNPDVVTYTSLMALLVKASPYRGRTTPEKRLEKAMDLYKEMLGRKVQPDAVTFNTLMYAGAQAKLPGRVLDIYRMMIAAGVSPNEFSFSILLEAVGSGGRLKAALEVFNEMRAAGLPPKSSTYNFLIEACASAPQPNPKKAWELLEEMKIAEDAPPNALTFSNLIAACTKGGDHSGAMEAYRQMLELGYSEAKSSSTFNKLIHSASIADGLESAFEMYEKMRGEGYKADVVTYSTLLSACTRAEDLERALTVSEEFEKLGILPNQVVLHSLIGGFGKADRWQDAVSTFRKMNILEEPATRVSYSILFGACFGKNGVEDVIMHKTTDGVLQMSPGIETAIELYNEAVAAGLYRNYKLEDLSRCDVRNNSRAAIVVALLAWLKAIQDAPPTKDLVVVVGMHRVKEPGKPIKGKNSWKYGVAQSTLRSVGLLSEQISTITLQAMTVRSQTLKTWLPGCLTFEKERGEASSSAQEQGQ